MGSALVAVLPGSVTRENTSLHTSTTHGDYHLRPQQQRELWWVDVWSLFHVHLALYVLAHWLWPRRQEPPSPGYIQYALSLGATNYRQRQENNMV